MCTLTYHFHPSTKEGYQPGRIFLRIIYRKKVINLSSPYRIYSEEWNRKEKCLFIPTGNSQRTIYLRDIQKKMDREKKELLLLIRHLEKKGEDGIKQVVNHYENRESLHLLSVFTDKLVTQLLEAGQERTAKAYKSVLKSVTAFNKGEELLLEDIQESFLKQYEKDLKIQGKALNTISFYIRNLRAIYNKAIQKGIIVPTPYSPFKGTYTGVEKTRKRALAKKEIILLNSVCFPPNNVRNKKIPQELYSEPLQRTLLFFFFCFHAQGMSFVDLAYLRKDNIQHGCISYYRKKTGRMITIKLTPFLNGIIQKFATETDTSDYVFPIILKNQLSERLQYESALRIYNMHLNRIGELLSMKQALTSHVARHSWASMAKHENLPLWVISEGLGHSNEKTTYIYLSSLEQSLIDKANQKIYKAIRGVV